MKKIRRSAGIFLLATVLCIQVNAQQYRLFKPYTNYIYALGGNAYFGFRIDEVKAGSDEDSLYLANSEVIVHNLNKTNLPCYYPFNFSWLSYPVVVKTDGTHILFNFNNDSIFIKTQATLNESWRFYTFPNGSHIDATVSKADTISVLGIPDSVKKITFKYFDSLGIQASYLTDNLYLEISKDHGLKHTLNFACFPDFEIETKDIDYLALWSFEMVGIGENLGIRNATVSTIFDFQPGDEFHVLARADYLYSSYERRRKEKILERVETAGWLKYRIQRTDFEKDSVNYGGLDTITFRHIDTVIWKTYNLSDPYINQLPINQFSENKTGSIWISTSSLRFYDQNRYIKSFEPVHDPYSGPGKDSCYYLGAADPCYCNDNYIEGLGGPYNEDCICLSCMTFNRLVYYKKGAETWGTPLGIEDDFSTENENSLVFYPNPVTSRSAFYIKAVTGFNLDIYDLAGKKLESYRGYAGNNIIKFSKGNYPAGLFIYLLRPDSGKIKTGKFEIR